jgi:hypothetical protein
VTKTVIVDAADNKVVAIFNHDTDPKADLELKKYIAGDTQVDTSAEITETDDGSSTQSNPGDSRSVEIPSDPQAQETLIKQLIETSKEQQRLLEELAQSYQAK